jgi:hypothetical protein
MESMLDRSAVYAYAVPPAASISARTSSSFSAPRATSSGIPPAAAIFSAAARPIPLEAPVMTTVRPLTAAPNERSRKRSGSRCFSQ